MKMQRVLARTDAASMEAGQFSWHPPGADTPEEVERVLRVCVQARTDMTAHDWPKSPMLWHGECPVARERQGEGVWWWNGDPDEPSLRPSLRLCSAAPGAQDEANVTVWHGYIAEGELVFVDSTGPDPLGEQQ